MIGCPRHTLQLYALSLTKRTHTWHVVDRARCACVSCGIWLPHSIIQSIAGWRNCIFAAGGHDATTHKQHDVSAQQSIMLSPLYTAKHNAGGSPSRAAQPADQTNLCLDAPPASKAASASLEDPHSDTVATEASSPSKYPDTRLYQFADIELAHGH